MNHDEELLRQEAHLVAHVEAACRAHSDAVGEAGMVPQKEAKATYEETYGKTYAETYKEIYREALKKSKEG
jgi:hypothetical protein